MVDYVLSIYENLGLVPSHTDVEDKRTSGLKNLNKYFRKDKFKRTTSNQVVEVHAFKPSSQEAEACGSL